MVRNSASPVAGKPRTKTLAPATPPEVSTQTPGTRVSSSAVLLGEALVMSSALTVVTAKLAASLSIPLPPGVPTTITSSTWAGVSGSGSTAVAGWPWVWALVATSRVLARMA